MTRQDVINKASSYLKSTPYPNPNQFTRWFWHNELQHAWCGAFVNYIFKQDLGCDWLDDCSNFGYVPTIVNWAKSKGYWTKDYTKAKTGDLVIFDWTVDNVEGYSHIGIVKSVVSDGIISVDGNTANDKYDGNCVAERKRNKKYISGVVLLPYNESGEDMKVGDIVYAKEDIKLYTSIEMKENLYNLTKGKGAIVKIVRNDGFIALGDKDTKQYFASAWTKELDKLTKDCPDTYYKELYEKELLVNKDLQEQLNIANEKINKAINDLK